MRTRGKRWRRVVTAAVIAGAATPAMLRWVRRTGTARRAVDMRMTVVVERPVGEVFEFCRDFENFPEVVNGFLHVTDHQDGRSHWQVQTPRGDAIEWDATITKYVPNSVIAWQSKPGSAVEARGQMRFAPLSATETRVDIALTYLPKHTGLAEAFSALLSSSNTKKLRADIAEAPKAMKAAVREAIAP
ncbi:MAG: SRPBCC family protein [Gemmatimonadaceae bacterium]